MATHNLLDRAISLHAEGKEDEAFDIYQKLINQNSGEFAPYLNASSILRKKQKLIEAVNLLQIAINKYPTESGLYNNMGNCLIDQGKDLLAIISFRQALRFDCRSVDPRLSLIACLGRLDYIQLAYRTAINGYLSSNKPEKFIVPLMDALYKLGEEQRGNAQDLNNSILEIERYLVNVFQDSPAHISSLLYQIWTQLGEFDRALEAREKLRETTNKLLSDNQGSKLKAGGLKTWHTLGWNLSIGLLRHGRLKEGWELFDHGLMVKAAGPQRWQRSLRKPFSSSEIPIWRGESLKGRCILILAEQGIGDTMMFASLLPKIVSEGAKIFLCPPDRLLDIYRRSFEGINIVSFDELKNKKVLHKIFDFQTPIGSICRYRFPDRQDYGLSNYKLLPNYTLTQELRSRYYDGRPLVGISWQGGGKDRVMNHKSVFLPDWIPILSSNNCRFVSLQYGDTSGVLKRFRENYQCEIFNDTSINPLKDMDSWLSQVDAMDYVITVANTTVHGAAAINKPTAVFVGKDADWRWIKPEIYSGSYWYPHISTFYQHSSGTWSNAVESVSSWLANQIR